MNLIPKKIHISWNDKFVTKINDPLLENGLKKLINLNHDWNLSISDDNDIDNYLKDNLSNKDFELIKNKHIVEKTDLWRLFKMYYEGGLYIDIDRLCNQKINDVIDDNILCVLPTCLDRDFSQDIMLSAPGNRIFINTINLILKRRNEGHTSTYFLGPQTFMHGVTYTFSGEIIDSHSDNEKFMECLKKIKKLPYICLYKESPPHDTFLYRNGDNTINFELLKRQFYAKSKIKHWTGEW